MFGANLNNKNMYKKQVSCRYCPYSERIVGWTESAVMVSTVARML